MRFRQQVRTIEQASQKQAANTPKINSYNTIIRQHTIALSPPTCYKQLQVASKKSNVAVERSPLCQSAVAGPPPASSQRTKRPQPPAAYNRYNSKAKEQLNTILSTLCRDSTMPNVGYSGSVSILVLALLKIFTKSERKECVQQCTNNQHNPVQ